MSSMQPFSSPSSRVPQSYWKYSTLKTLESLSLLLEMMHLQVSGLFATASAEVHGVAFSDLVVGISACCKFYHIYILSSWLRFFYFTDIVKHNYAYSHIKDMKDELSLLSQN